MIRRAGPNDIHALVQLESSSLSADPLTREQFRHFLTRAHAVTLIEEIPGGPARGYATLLFHRGTRSARLYSIAVDQREQRKGIARHLLAAVEDEASRSHCTRVRLEVRSDNFPARSLYKSVGYEPFGIYPRYYLDGEDAIRMQRGLRAAQVVATAR